jgi:hypothetical protein
MSAKRLIIVTGCVLICFLIAGFTCQHWLRVQYHLHALRQANSEVASAQKEQDCKRQNQALVKLGYLEEVVLVMEHRVVTGAVKQAFTGFVSERMPTNAVYSFWVSSSGTKIVCCCQKTEVKRFWSVVDDFDKQ